MTVIPLHTCPLKIPHCSYKGLHRVLPSTSQIASHKHLHLLIMQLQAEVVGGKKIKIFSQSLIFIIVFSTSTLRRTSSVRAQLVTLGAAHGRECCCALLQLPAIKQTEQKEFDNKWEADMWHQGASFMVGFPSILRYTVKLICHQDESLCLSGLSVSVFS